MGEWGSISPECVAVQMMFAVNGKYKCARGSSFRTKFPERWSCQNLFFCHLVSSLQYSSGGVSVGCRGRGAFKRSKLLYFR